MEYKDLFAIHRHFFKAYGYVRSSREILTGIFDVNNPAHHRERGRKILIEGIRFKNQDLHKEIEQLTTLVDKYREATEQGQFEYLEKNGGSYLDYFTLQLKYLMQEQDDINATLAKIVTENI